MLEVRGSSMLRSAGSGILTDTPDAMTPAVVPNQQPPLLPASQSNRTLLKASSLLLRTSTGQAPALTVDALLAAAVVVDNSAIALTHIADSPEQHTGVVLISNTALSSTATASPGVADPSSIPYSADIWSLGTAGKDSKPLKCGGAEFKSGPVADPAPERKSDTGDSLSAVSSLNAVAAAEAAAVSAVPGSSARPAMATPLLPPPPSQTAKATFSSSSVPLSSMPSFNALEEGSDQPPLHTWPAQPCTNAQSQCAPMPLHHQPPNPPLQEQQQQLNRSVSAVSSSCSSTASRGGISSFGSSSWGSSRGNSDFLGSCTSRGCGASSNSNDGSWLSVKGGGISAGYEGDRAGCSARVTSSRGGTTTRMSLTAAQGPGGVSAMRRSTTGATAANSCGTGGGLGNGGSYSYRSILRDGIGLLGTPPVVQLGGIDMAQGFGCGNSNSGNSSLRGSSRPASALLEPLKREEGTSQGERVGAVAAEEYDTPMAALLAAAASASASSHVPRRALTESIRQHAAPGLPDGCGVGGDGVGGGSISGVRSPSFREAGSRSTSVIRRVPADRPSASSIGIQDSRSKVLPVSSSSLPLKPAVTGGIASLSASRAPAVPPRQMVGAGKGSTSQRGVDGDGSGGDDVDNARAGADAAEAMRENSSQRRVSRAATQRSMSSSSSPKRSRSTRRSSSGGSGNGSNGDGSAAAVSSSGPNVSSSNSTRLPRRGRRSSSKQLMKSSGSSSSALGGGVAATASPRSRSCTPSSSPRASAANSLSGSCQFQLSLRAKSGSTPYGAAAEAPSGPSASASAAPRMWNSTSPQVYFHRAVPGVASGRYNLAIVYGPGAKAGCSGNKAAASSRAPLQGHLACASASATWAATPRNASGPSGGSGAGDSSGPPAVKAGNCSDREQPGRALSELSPLKPTTASPPSLLLVHVPVRTPEPSVPPLLPSSVSGSGGILAADAPSMHGNSIATGAAAAVVPVLAVADLTQGLRLCIGSAGAAVGPGPVAETAAVSGPVKSASFGLQSAPHSPRCGGSATVIGQVIASGSSSSWRPALEPLACPSSGRHPHDLTINSAAAAATEPGVLGTPLSGEPYWSSEHQRRRTPSSFTGDGVAADPPPARTSPPRLLPLDSVPAVPLPTHVADAGCASAAGCTASVGPPSLQFPPKPLHLAPLQSHHQPDLAAGSVGGAASSRVSTQLRDLPSLEQPQTQHHKQQQQQQQQHMHDVLDLGTASRAGDSNGHASMLHVAPFPFSTTTPLDWRKPSAQPLQYQ
ncbi:hypothetical protein VaNZ11_006270, partial [Volvox africanus]